jgi:beta-lactamase regulating signal transducer with metallopeptidase domain/Skp family chaperone for outer membrane proteins
MELLQIGLANAASATGLAIVAAVVTKLGARPTVVHGLWLLVLLKLVMPPLVSLPIATFPAASAVAESPLTTSPTSGRGEELPFRESPGALAPAGETSSAGRLLVRALPASGEHWPALDWKSVICWAWLTGSICCFVVSATRVIRFHRLVSQTESASGDWIRQVEKLAARFDLRRCPDARVVDAATPPMVWSVGYRSTLLLPRKLLARLGGTERATLLAHEVAHIRRGDPYVRWFEAMVLGLYWWHPVAWIACRALQNAAERCCDEWVLRIFPGSGHCYANTLFETADFLAETPRALPLGASGLGHAYPLSRRIEMIVKSRTYRRLSRRTRVVAALAVGAVLSVSPVFMRAGDSPAPPEAKSKPCSSETEPVSKEAGVKPSAARRVVVVDVTYLIKNHDGFRRSMESMKASVMAATDRVRRQRDEIAKLEGPIKEAKGDTERTALEAKISVLQREAQTQVNAQKEEFLQQEMEIYRATWNEINAAIAQYAKQHDIDLVMRHNMLTDSLPKHVNQKPISKQGKTVKEDASLLIARINANVIYRSPTACDDEADITQAVLAKLNHVASGPEKSAR